MLRLKPDKVKVCNKSKTEESIKETYKCNELKKIGQDMLSQLGITGKAITAISGQVLK